MSLEPYLKLYKPHMKGVCLEYFFSYLGEESEQFAYVIHKTCPKKFGWFHQGGANALNGGWHLFEFWNFRLHPTEIMSYCQELAKQFDKELIIELPELNNVTGDFSTRAG